MIQACDVVLIGGGLANSLIALALRRSHPALSIVMIERRTAPDDDHTWCLFESDVAAVDWTAIAPLLDPVWSGYDVVFPDYVRSLTTRYGRLSSASLAGAVETSLGGRLLRGRVVHAVTPDTVSCDTGEMFRAGLVIDGRGAAASPHIHLAFQKFVGLEVILSEPHGVTRPVIMDASVTQVDGYRFVYVLPLAPDRLLIEDTRYSDTPGLDAAALQGEVLRYADQRRWQVSRTMRSESGALPIVLGGDFAAHEREYDAAVPRVGMRGLFFHATTGYSLPSALRVARLIAAASSLESPTVARMLRADAASHWRRQAFNRALNRMMFLACEPTARYRILQRFYRLPQGLIERFYGGTTTIADKIRLVSGRPPVPVRRALPALFPSAAAGRARG